MSSFTPLAMCLGGRDGHFSRLLCVCGGGVQHSVAGAGQGGLPALCFEEKGEEG